MSNINPHRLEGNMTQEQIDHIMALTSPTEITTYMHELELSAGLRVPDAMNPSVLHEVQQVAEAAPKFTITVAGQTFTADTAEELSAKSSAAIQAAVQAKNASDDIARNPNGTFRAQQVGEAADRIAGGIVTKALQEELGISPEELKASVAQIREGNQIVTSWAAATKDFLKANPDYQGNEETVRIIGEKLQELGLDDKPSAASLQRAYDALAEEAERYLRIKDATSPQEIRDALGITERENNGSRYRR
jgi:hypothetical protein